MSVVDFIYFRRLVEPPLYWKDVERYGKTTIFPGGYGRIGKIQHGWLWPIGVCRKHLSRLTLFIELQKLQVCVFLGSSIFSEIIIRVKWGFNTPTNHTDESHKTAD